MTIPSTPAQRTRRKIAREVAAMWDAIARASGFKPIERRTAWAITMRLYERAGEDCETPREIALATIGAALTSRSDDREACAQAARRQCGKLFNQAMPRTGFQILTRYKVPEDEEEEKKRPHQYSDHLMPVAAFFSELLAEETQMILSTKGFDRKTRREKIEEARARMVAEALDYLPPCDTELITPEGESYAYLSAPEAIAYQLLNPDYSIRPFQYSLPPEEAPRLPLTGADFKRLKDRAVKRAIDEILNHIAKRNSVEEAQIFWRTELMPALQRAGSSWVKVATTQSAAGEERQEELIHGRELRPLNPEIGTESNTDDLWKKCHDVYPVRPDKLSGLTGSNVFADNTEKIESLETDPVENPPILTGSENFDSALDAALFYARDGRPVLPICNFNPVTGRCTASWHKPDKEGNPCTGKKPLVKGKGKPGDGYTAATTDLDQIRKWWGRDFPDAGVGGTLQHVAKDGTVTDEILIDADVKDGGLESYALLRDTFALPETLTAITQSSGGHFVFDLPDLPEDHLKSWTRVGDKVALPGIDIKVGIHGLIYLEPTRGKKGTYRWVDPTFPKAELPRACADFLHAARYKDEEKSAEKARTARVYSSSSAPQEFDPDQERYFVDAAKGDRHKRLLKVARAIRATGAGEDQIKKALNYHAAHFTEPLDDQQWIDRVAAECALKFQPGVEQ